MIGFLIFWGFNGNFAFLHFFFVLIGHWLEFNDWVRHILWFRFLFGFLFLFRFLSLLSFYPGSNGRSLLFFSFFFILNLFLDLNLNLFFLPSSSLHIHPTNLFSLIILSLILIAIRKNFISFTMLKIILKLPFIIGFIWVGPFSIPRSQAILEFAFIYVAILPYVFALSVRPSFIVAADVLVAVDVFLSTLSLF